MHSADPRLVVCTCLIDCAVVKGNLTFSPMEVWQNIVVHLDIVFLLRDEIYGRVLAKVLPEGTVVVK